MLKLAFRTPVTTFSWIVLVAVFIATHGAANDSPNHLSQLRRKWGGVESLSWVKIDGPREEVVTPQLTGPFDLWDGQWWRVPLTSLHHVGILHLVMNLTCVVVFGPWLEQRWGWWRYLLFLVAAACVSMSVEYLLDNYAIGYSGVCCAIFGALLVLRTRDAELQDLMPEEWVALMLGTLVAMIAVTWVGMIQIANAAHFTGLGYGMLAGAVGRLKWPVRGAFALAHVFLFVPYWCLVHPTWNGRYQWYLADLERRENSDAAWDIARLKLAVKSDPMLSEVWRMLSEESLERNAPLEAWDYLLQGLEHNPSDQDQWRVARQRWRKFASSDDRPRAVKVVEDRFGSAAAGWLAELRRTVPPPVLIAPDRPPEPIPLELMNRIINDGVLTTPKRLPATQAIAEQSPPHPQVEWEAPPENAWSPQRVPPGGPLPAVNPAHRNSAVEGELL